MKTIKVYDWLLERAEEETETNLPRVKYKVVEVVDIKDVLGVIDENPFLFGSNEDLEKLKSRIKG